MTSSARARIDGGTEPRCTRGGQQRYSALAITTALTLPAFNCYRAAGSSNEPWLGSIETAAWQRISRLRLRAPKRGFTSPLYSSLSGDWLDRYAMYLRYNTTIPIRIQTLNADECST